MSIVRRLTLIVVVVALLSGAAYGVGWATHRSSESSPTTATATEPTAPAQPVDVAPSPEPTPEPTPEPDPEPTPEPTPTPKPEPEPELQPGPALLSPGDESDEVRDLQARLRQIDWFEADVTGFYGDLTTEAVRGFQAKREIPVTGAVDRRTLDRLLGMTSEPTAAELTNQLGDNVPGALDPRCLTGRVLCIDKTSSTLRWVVGGEVLRTVDTRFGGSATPTREGTFSVDSKSRDHVSSLFDTPMPFAMFFSRGQAVHYSPDFAAVGYAGASHGCVNVRDYDAIAWLYDQVAVGDTVIVYRS
ncbi:L,D-transpeptidase family protein [Nocardioides psychrotolerans]|uniref:L,D-transpeptidase family protein n=1 Tax=Nocardioides psychrotolerans TaxID=1005945 RepID=UPI0031379EBF